MARLAAAVVVLFSTALGCGYVDPAVHRKVVEKAEAHGLDPLLLAALVWVESRYCPEAVGRAGEVGLGQVKPVVAKQYGVPEHRLYNVDVNLELAARYLRDLYLRFGDWVRALAAYNRGPTRVLREGVDRKGMEYAYQVLWTYSYWKRGGSGK